MKLCLFGVQTPLGLIERVGVYTEQGVVDATAARQALLERRMPPAAAQRVGAAQVPSDMIALIGSGQLALDWLQEAVDALLLHGAPKTSQGACTIYQPSGIQLLAPIKRPAGIVNFSVWPAHSVSAASLGIELAANTAQAHVKPYWKGNPDAVVGPETLLHRPPYADELDVECELVCIVGTGGRDLDRAAAQRAIVGYSIMNDVSARERQSAEMKFGRGPSKGKDFDNGYPLGPWIVTADELGDPKKLRMSLLVNGIEHSACDTNDMIWDFPEMLSYLSIGQTVQPGLVISGGCYPGGSAHEVGVHLKPGDQVEMRISRIGSLINTVAL
jgi:2-keto-4-pentenoate hydratase/2-oxohepta-3-ene-1,7-dioic acid hydratase in catechol pathway